MKIIQLYRIFILLILCFTVNVLQSTMAQSVSPASCPPNTIIEIPDKGEFYPRLIFQFGKSRGDSITCADMQSLTSFIALNGSTIDLTGIEYAINLTSLALHNVKLKSFKPIENLKNIQELEIRIDSITPPRGGFRCDDGRGGRRVSDFDSILNLKALKILSLQGQNIEDLSFLDGFNNLEALNLRCNNIEDLNPLTTLTKLQSLVLSGNLIIDVSSLANLSNLETLAIGENCPESLIPIASITSLQALYIAGDNYGVYCSTTGFQSLAALTNLQDLHIERTNFNQLSIVLNFPNLQKVNFARNELTNITALAQIMEQDSLQQNIYSKKATIDLRANKISIQDLEDLSLKLSNIQPDLYELRFAYNPIDMNQKDILSLFETQGIGLDFNEYAYDWR